MRPCSASSSSGVTAAARSIISRTAGSWSLDLGALGVAEHLDVEQQRLLDLGVVEQVAAALGRDLGMVGQHDRRAEHHVVLGAASTGPRVDAVAGRVERRDEPPAGDAQDRVRRDQRAPERGGAVEPSGASVRFSTRRRPAAGRPSSGVSREPGRARTPADAELALARRSAAARPGGARRSAPGNAPRPSTSPPPSATHCISRWSYVLGSAARRRAGRRSRTASAWRSWPRRACTGRARSPRTAAFRPARRHDRSEQLRHAGVERRQRRARPSRAGAPAGSARCSGDPAGAG